MSTRSSILSTSHGTNRAAFGLAEWGLLVYLATLWGGSFLFIAIGLDSLSPGVVTVGRVTLGALALFGLPSARRKLDREDWPRVIVLAFTWVAIPFTLFPLAQQWINSAVAGMLNGGMPIFAALIAMILLKELPGRWQRIGLTVGFVGIIAISVPTMGKGSNAAIGVLMLIVAVALYGLSVNLVTPLQQKYGSVPVMARMLQVAAVLTLPYGLISLPSSQFEWGPVAAVVVLGVLGTGLAFAAMAELAGRVGGTRASVITYLIPVVAIVLGVVFRDDAVAPLALVGIVLVIAGAGITSLPETRS